VRPPSLGSSRGSLVSQPSNTEQQSERNNKMSTRNRHSGELDNLGKNKHVSRGHYIIFHSKPFTIDREEGLASTMFR